MENKTINSSKDLDDKTFRKILYRGFYYIENGKIYWEPNAIFIGNGYCDHMVKTHSLGFPEFANGDGPATKDQHYWDWGKKDEVWNFSDYGKTWSADEEILEEEIRKNKKNS